MDTRDEQAKAFGEIAQTEQGGRITKGTTSGCYCGASRGRMENGLKGRPERNSDRDRGKDRSHRKRQRGTVSQVDSVTLLIVMTSAQE